MCRVVAIIQFFYVFPLFYGTVSLLALQLTSVLLLFVLGLRASAFFSGAETGYYRLSLPRLRIDAQAGDQQALRLLWFAARPTEFVATTLLGNNLANFITTLAISSFAILLWGDSPRGELVMTLAWTPLVFLFGELLPKNLYFRAPYSRMSKDIGWFVWFHRLCRPLIFPLVVITRLIERLAKTPTEAGEVISARRQFAQILHQGRHEGVLVNSQGQLASGALGMAMLPVSRAMTPADRVLGVDESASREQVLAFARTYGLSIVPLHTPGQERDWKSYVRIVDLVVNPRQGRLAIRKMPTLSIRTTKLQALRALREHDARYAAVLDDTGQVAGIVSERGLMESFQGRHQHQPYGNDGSSGPW